MEKLIKRINRCPINNDKNFIFKYRKVIDYNIKKHHIFLRLESILSNENKKPYYKRIVFRLFSYLLVYLEKIKSNTIKIVFKNDHKYYYSKRLNLKDAENFFLNTDKYNSTKYYYLSIIKKYIRLLNKNSSLYFSKKLKLIRPKPKRNTLAFNIRQIIQKLKDINKIEFLCVFYVLYFLGLSLYQLTKLTIRNYNSNSFVYISYKFRKQIIKKKHISKAMKKYFEQYFAHKKNSSGFLFFNHVKDKQGNTRKNQIKKIIENFFTTKLKLTKNETKEIIEELNRERKTKTIAEKFKYIFEPYIKIIDDSNIFI
jgi:hypothetical protein